MLTFFQVCTSLPDATGKCAFVYDKGQTCDSAACNSSWGDLGGWVFGRISFDFCGDMIWSGHSERVIVGLISVTRILADKYGDEWYEANKIKVRSEAQRANKCKRTAQKYTTHMSNR